MILKFIICLIIAGIFVIVVGEAICRMIQHNHYKNNDNQQKQILPATFCKSYNDDIDVNSSVYVEKYNIDKDPIHIVDYAVALIVRDIDVYNKSTHGDIERKVRRVFSLDGHFSLQFHYPYVTISLHTGEDDRDDGPYVRLTSYKIGILS